VSHPASIAFLAAHEARLSWRDWVYLMTAGRRHRTRTVAVVLVVFGGFMHLVAYGMVGTYVGADAGADKATLVAATGLLLLLLSLLLSQAMESVTRAFYARADLDLILTSPVAPRKIFSLRISAIAASVTVLAMLLAAPFIDVLAVLGGPRWLAAFGAVGALGAVAASLAVALTVALFRVIGPKRTRFIAQVVAAVIGAAFVIGLQVAAILSYGNLSRFAPLQSAWLIAHAPSIDSPIWLPARAALGDLSALGLLAATAAIVLGATVAAFAGRFGDHVMAAAGVAMSAVRQARSRGFRDGSAGSVLRRKEWTLLVRDPWLMSQTLMQILYLLPPALMLWRSFHSGVSAYIVIVPVLVMAAGQLAGGLAWLSISGEDAPNLVATAPVQSTRIIAAKVEAVMGAIALVFAPLILALAFASPRAALVSATGIAIAAGSATLIQLYFRVQARRSQFRRRQVSSRIATFAEAFSSISWAATAALAVAGSWLTIVAAAMALGVLAGARAISPRRLD